LIQSKGKYFLFETKCLNKVNDLILFNHIVDANKKVKVLDLRTNWTTNLNQPFYQPQRA